MPRSLYSNSIRDRCRPPAPRRVAKAVLCARARNVSAAVAQPGKQPGRAPARAEIVTHGVPGSTTVAEAPPLNDYLAAPLEQHPSLVRGRLDNGFEYVILPNKSPPGRFEAHLQVRRHARWGSVLVASPAATTAGSCATDALHACCSHARRLGL
jgi:hypothetical protein